MIHTLERTQLIPAPLGRVWEYFATPANLNALTPPDLQFKILDRPGPMHVGQRIKYRIRLLPGVRVRWITEIREVNHERRFVDVQLRGPYAVWHHAHEFTAVNGGVEMLDRVTYALPFGSLGALVHTLWVGRTLRRIFDYRQQAVVQIFSA